MEEQQTTLSSSLSELMKEHRLQHDAFKKLDEALQGFKSCDKKDLLKALEVAPKLVFLESDPVKFLRFSNLDAAAAAHRLMHYWKTRCETFGERAFLPLAITGTGALLPPEIRIVKSGVVVFLPPDDHGCQLMCTENSRRINHSLQDRLRAAFYHGHIIAEKYDSQTAGVVALLLVSDPDLDADTTECTKLLLNTFPFKIKALHVFNCIPQRQKSNGVLTDFVGMLTKIFGSILKDLQYFVHSSQDKEEIVATMQSHGLAKESLPEAVGGVWSYESFATWITERQDYEKDHYLEFILADSNTEIKEGTEKGHVVCTRSSMEIWHQQIDDAIEQFSCEEKSAYFDAKRCAPQKIWDEECNHSLFLRVEFFNPWLAAKRLAGYWILRSDCFGPKKYDLLSQTGEDALGRKDLLCLTTGFIKLLPYDSDGCSVIWIDGARLHGIPSNEKNRDRCLFYMFSLLAENPASQANGFVLLLMYRPSFSGGNGEISYNFLDRLVQFMPVNVKAVHLFAHEVIPEEVASRFDYGGKVYHHIASSKEGLLSSIETCGFERKNLPRALNGDWALSTFVQWQELRTRMEWRIPLGVSSREHAEALQFPAIRPYEVLSDEEKSERVRRLNVIHCRRKRDRKLVEIDELQKQCDDLNMDHENLLKEQRRLENLVIAARMEAEKSELARMHASASTLDRQIYAFTNSVSVGDTQHLFHRFVGQEALRNAHAAQVQLNRQEQQHMLAESIITSRTRLDHQDQQRMVAGSILPTHISLIPTHALIINQSGLNSSDVILHPIAMELPLRQTHQQIVPYTTISAPVDQLEPTGSLVAAANGLADLLSVPPSRHQRSRDSAKRSE